MPKEQPTKSLKLVCTECGHRLALCVEYVQEFEPDQEPYESGVEEQVESVDCDFKIGLSELVTVRAFVCPNCGIARHVWTEDYEPPNRAVARLTKELADAKAELVRVTRANRKIHDHLKQAIAIQVKLKENNQEKPNGVAEENEV